MSEPFVLIVMDGYGLRAEADGNAVMAAQTPVLDKLFKNNPWSKIKTDGEASGLPEGQMGNSEVGHMNLGAGRIVYQPLTRINKQISSGDFFENSVLVEGFNQAKKAGSTVHLMGLLSDGGVHSHIEHLFALLDMARQTEQSRVAIHALLDGRDVPPRSGQRYIARLVAELKERKIGKIATIGGRYYGMDRDNRWERTELAYRAIVEGNSEFTATDPLKAIENAYQKRDENDEFVQPTVMVDQNNKPVATINSDDTVIFFNFRPDRARQLTTAITADEFSEFSASQPDVNFICLTEYDEHYQLPVAYPPVELNNVLAEHLSKLGLTQFHTAETEKYAHVTFFFNGGKEQPFPGEERELIPSPKVSTYEQQPEMSADEVTQKLIKRLTDYNDDFIIVNYANPDMVGHTGYFEAAVKAVETVDSSVGKLLKIIRKLHGQTLITADHGNAEQMFDPEEDDSHTAHTMSPVPLIYDGDQQLELKDGILADIAATILHLMNQPVPHEMTGDCLAITK